MDNFFVALKTREAHWLTQPANVKRDNWIKSNLTHLIIVLILFFSSSAFCCLLSFFAVIWAVFDQLTSNKCANAPGWVCVLSALVCVRACVCMSYLVGRNHYGKLYLKDMQNSKPSTVPWLLKDPRPQQVKQTQMGVGFIIIQSTVVCALPLWPRVTGQCYMPVE